MSATPPGLAITGARRLPLALRPALAESLLALFRAYPGPGWLLTPLAEGADRLAAEAALLAGWRLHAVLPMAQAAYEQDFAEPATPGTTPESCLAEFRALLAQSAQVTVLAGDPSQRPAAYEAAGAHVVAGCSMLVAVWDGAKGGGRGGTGATIHHAVRQGKPVWWLPIQGGAPRIIAGEPAFETLRDLPAGADAWAWLRARLIPPGA